MPTHTTAIIVIVYGDNVYVNQKKKRTISHSNFYCQNHRKEDHSTVFVLVFSSQTSRESQLASWDTTAEIGTPTQEANKETTRDGW